MKFVSLLTRRFLLQSLVPVFLVFVSIFVLIGIVKYRSVEDVSSTLVVRIPASVQETFGESDADEEEGYEEVAASMEGLSEEQQATLTRARAHVTAREWNEAEKIYRDMLTEQDSAVVLTDLGMLYYRMGDPDRALRILDDAVKEHAEVMDAWFSRGVVLSALQRYPEAVRDYRKVIERNPHHIESHINLGLALGKSGDSKESIAVLEQAVTMSGGDKKAKVLTALGDAYRKAGKAWDEKAREAYVAAIRVRPDYVLPRMRLARLEPDTRAGRKRAMGFYQDVMRLDPSHARSRFFAARLSKESGDPVMAEKYYREAIRIRPGYIKARYNLALILLDRKENTQAARQFQEILARDEGHTRSLLQMGRIAYKDKRYADAHAWYDRAQKVAGGDYAEAWLNKGLVSVREKDYPSALKYYRRAIEIESGYEQAFYNMALVYSKTDDFANAEKNYRKALSIRNNYPTAWYNLAVLYSRSGKNVEAIQAYEKAIEVRPDYHKAMLNLGVLYSRENQHRKAVGIYREVLDQDATYAKAWFNLGLANMELQDYDSAIDALSRGVELQPENLQMRSNLAGALMAAGKFEASIREYRKAVSLDEADVEIRVAMAQAMVQASRQEEAMAMLNQSLALDPGNEDIIRQIRELSKLVQ